MRVCRITDAFPPPWRGLNPGPYELSRAQQRAGVDLEVIAKDAPGSAPFDRSGGLHVHRIRGRYYAFEVSALRKLLELCRARPFDVIHLHGNTLALFHLIRNVLRVKTPVAVSVHCVRKAQKAQIPEIYASLNPFFKRFLSHEILREKICFMGADILLPVSENLKEEIIRFYGVAEDRMKVIGNGVDLERFKSNEADGTGAKKRARPGTVLYAGVLNGRKNELLLIEAFAQAVKKAEPGKLVIIGEGPSLVQCKEKARGLGIENLVDFEGYVPYEKMASFFNASDIFVLPSFYEGLPKVLLEAMGCGKAVIASDIPGNREVVSHGETGFLFNPRSVEELAEAIRRLLSDAKRASIMGANARDLVRRKYTWDAVALRCAEAYNILTKKGKA